MLEANQFAAELSLDALDITDASLYASRGYPCAEWHLLRREAPVFGYDRPGIDPFWAITKHAHLLATRRFPVRDLGN